MAAGKPVVIIDSGLKGDTYVSFVATDNREGGRRAARHLGATLAGTGKVLLLRYMVGSASTTEREAGFVEVMESDFPGIALLPEGLGQYAGATMGEAQEVAETLLNTYTELDGIFCPNESSATGMLEALKKIGRAGKVRFVGFDASDKLIQGMEEGQIDGLILQDPVGMAATGVRTLAAHILGEQVERRIDTGVYLVTPETMQEPEMQRLLRPDISILSQ
jgi:ribose transport system substrate-binding protein